MWSRRNKNTSPDEGDMRKSKALVLRILRWAEAAKSDKTGQEFVCFGEEFKKDLHSAVVIDNYETSKTGLSKNEKREANILWKKYSILGRICDEKKYGQTFSTKLDSRHVVRT